MPAITLPQEVVVRILNSLDDRQTLCNCALVCRHWCLPARCNLFYRLAIADRESFDLLVHLRDAPHIAPAFEHVHSLQLWDDNGQPWIQLFPCMFSSLLPHMHFLTLGNFKWDASPLDRGFDATGTHFPSVTTLKIANGKFHSFDDFSRVVCAFTQLAQLYVDNVEWRTTASGYGGVTSYYPRLKMLWYKSRSENTVTPLLDWLIHSSVTETLGDIQILEQYSGDFPAIQRLTRAMGSRLSHFQVSLRFWTPDTRLDLSANTSLQTLHVRDIDASSCRYLPLLLEELSPGFLGQLTLYLHIPTLADLGVVRTFWTDVGDILARPEFAPLATVRVWLLRVPPAAAVPFASLKRELESWMPLRVPGETLHVNPWLYLDG